MNNKKIVGQRNAKLKFANNQAILLLSILLIAILFALTSVSFVSAITGTSSNITMNAAAGTISTTTSANNIDTRTISPWSTIGAYSGENISGEFGRGLDQESTISLLTPLNNRIDTSTMVTFTYNVSATADQCNLYVDGILKGINYYVNVGPNEFIMSVTPSKHYWNISCISNSITKWSDTQTFSVVLLPAISNINTTNVSGINMYAVPNFTLEKTGIAKILFGGTIDLSNGGDMANNIIFSRHSVTINSGALPALNRSATITMYDVDYTNPIIWRDGQQCTDCTVDAMENNTLIFTVTGFSTYNITASTALRVWDDTDTILTQPNNNLTVYAHYTNILTGDPIADINGQCTISINNNGWSTPEIMQYNNTSELYYYNTTFNSSGTRPYVINCTNYIGLDNLVASDAISISGSVGTLSRLVAETGQSSRMEPNNAPSNITAGAGNMTELLVDHTAVTNSWQGYYGNITGVIYLKDATNNTFYNWNMSAVTGEIYASRSINIDWDTIACAQTAQLSVEDEFIGANASDGDSVFNTFYPGASYTEFYTGMNRINDAGCYVAHLNDDSGLGSTKFTELLLTDNNALVYASLLNNDVLGFDGRSHDFQILVGENGHNNDNNPTTYYFFLEIG